LFFEEKHDTVESMKIKLLKTLINDYLMGKKINLFEKSSELGIDLALNEKFRTDFSKKVIKALLDTKSGDILAYSDIGSKIGTRAYRAIGNILSRNPLPLIIPCHRVIRKNGTISGFMGKMDESWQRQLKIDLLKIEGSSIIVN